MALGFIQIVPRALIGPETISNVFWYALELGLETSPSQEQQDAAIDSFLTVVLTPLRSFIPTDGTYLDVTARSWQVDGTPSEVLPSIRAVSLTGLRDGDRDGNAHVANLAFAMGDLVAFSGSAAALRSSRVGIGPLINAAVANDGTFVPSGLTGTVASGLATAVATPLDVDGTDDGLPVRVSHVLAGVATPNVTSYRLVTGAFYRTYTGHLRGRMNRK